MKSTYATIKEHRVQAIKSKDKLTRNVLDLVIGHMDNAGVGRKEGQDQENAVQESLRAVKQVLNGTYNALVDPEVVKTEEVNEAIALNAREHTIVEKYLIKNMTNEEVEALIDSYLAQGLDFSSVMKQLRTNYPNLYDGKHASSYAKSKA